MRYTHGFEIIRNRHHAFSISVFITVALVLLIIILGFTTLDAKSFFFGFAQSGLRVLTAYVVSLVIALSTALFVSSNKRMEEALLPVLDALQSFPSFAFYPLFVLWFGRTSVVPILILIVEMIWPILFTVLTARKQIRQDLLEAASVFGAHGLKFYKFVLFPLLLPSIVTGSIIARGEAWEAIIAAEIIVNVQGVGTYLASFGERSQSNLLLIGIFLLLIMLFLINKYFWVPLLIKSTKYQQES